LNSKIDPSKDRRSIFPWLWIPLVLFAALLAVTLYGPFNLAAFLAINGVAALTVRRARTAALFLILAFLVGLSRIAAGVHWPADVAAGALLGWGTAAAGVWLAGKLPIARSVSFRRIAGLILFAGLTYAASFYNPRMPQARWTVKAVACAGFAWGMYPYVQESLNRKKIEIHRV